MPLRLLVPILAGLALAAAPLAGGSSSASLTADQIFVGELKGARDAARVAFRQLTPWNLSTTKVSRAKAELALVRKHLRRATSAVPSTIGGLDEEIDANLVTATRVSVQASAELRKGNYVRARDNIEVTLGASQTALSRFGVPLAREFAASATYRELGNIEGWEEYMGLTAKVGAPIAKIVIGLAGRETANAEERGGRRGTPLLQINKLAIYTLQEPSGAYSSGWGNIVNGIIVCNLNPTMKANETFAVSFGPRVPKGTKFLVKFWSTDGRRSYAILTTK
ncbi:MAG TPA: hypothetical protein VFR32_07195 [Gaiellaceae bacterium]|nr:hypothetical protein [Gaiellaceae bacterium]